VTAGAGVFEAEHEWPALLSDEEAEDAANGIEGDFQNCVHDAANIAARLITVLESVALGDCLGCRNVLCRVCMLIEDAEIQDQQHEQDHRRAYEAEKRLT
jgi:hypothetical protein